MRISRSKTSLNRTFFAVLVIVTLQDCGNKSNPISGPNVTVTTLARSTYGYADGKGTAAKFYTPTGVAVDASGNVYVADLGNSKIRKITREGTVTTVAGSTSGYLDGQGATAKFNKPADVAVDGNGNVYVAVIPTTRCAK